MSHDTFKDSPWVAQTVSQWHEKGLKDVYTYTLEDKTEVTCTENHNFLTEDGFMLEIDKVYQQNLSLKLLKD